MKEKMILRQYRLTKEDDLLVKRNAKKVGGEAQYIRLLIRQGLIPDIRIISKKSGKTPISLPRGFGKML